MGPDSTSHRFYDSHPLRSKDEIRVLILHPASEQHLRIVCDLQVISLDNETTYEAVSYTWGPPFENLFLRDEAICLCDTIVSVTGNLFRALQRFRHTNTARILWVDALCINQSDISERSAQVAMMSQVYAGAQRVLVWFGEDSDRKDGKISFDIVRKLAGVSEWDIVQAIMHSHSSGAIGIDHFYSVMAQLISQGEAALNTAHVEDPRTNSADDTSRHENVIYVMSQVRYFFTRRYLRRLWVVQEMYHSKNGILFCGDHDIFWQTFQRGFERLRKAGTRILLEGHQGDALLENLDGTIIERIPRMLKLSRNANHFLRCIELTHGTACQDPRDRIFALSSIGTADWLQPDYSLSLEQVYTNFTKSCIEHEFCESVLYRASRQLANPVERKRREEIMPDCPSWAVDWGELSVSHGFWVDQEDGGRAFPNGIIDDHERLWCTLAVLGVIESGDEPNSKRILFEGDYGSEAVQSTEPYLEHAVSEAVVDDVLCRISTHPAITYANGDWQAADIENKLLVLRPTSMESLAFTLAPIGTASIDGASSGLRGLSPERVRRRFCIV